MHGTEYKLILNDMLLKFRKKEQSQKLSKN